MIFVLCGGYVNVIVVKISEVVSLVKLGELKLLVLFIENRLEGFEDVFILIESGYFVIFGFVCVIVVLKGILKEII